MDWDKLRIFHAVAEAGSFTRAGEHLHLSQSAVSRQISALEESLKTPLFHRHARGLILTEQGEILFRTAHEVYAKLAMAEARISENQDEARGPLKVTTTVAFGSIWLTPRMRAFKDLYPDIDLSLVLADNELDLSMREADVAIRLAPPREPDLVQRALMTMHYRVYGSHEYLARRGTPESAGDLDRHDIVAYGEDARPPLENLNWLLSTGGREAAPRKPVLRVNSIYGIFRAVQSGIGIGALPDYMSREASDLEEVLPDLRGPSIGAFFVYPSELRSSKRIAVFRDFLIERMHADDRKPGRKA